MSSYQPYLIAAYATGLDREVEPWLLPDDAQEDLFDGFVYRGVWQKREGYNYFAIGLRDGSPYTESRIVRHVTNQVGAVGNGTTGPYNINFFTVFQEQIATGNGTVGPYSEVLGQDLYPGSVIIIEPTTPQSLSDNGAGVLTGNGSGTVNYATGSTSFTFTTPVGIGDPINATYSNKPIRRGSITITDPVSGQELTDNGLGLLIGDGSGTVDYTNATAVATFNTPVAVNNILVTFDFFPGNPVMMIANFYTATNARELIVADTQYVNRYNETTNRLEDISGSSSPYHGTNKNFFSWVNYPSAADQPRLLFANNAPTDVIQQYDGATVTDYVYTSGTITTLNCLQLFNFKDRLILLRTTENGTVFPRRIRISGTGANCDNFDSSATGAGFIDIPDNTWIMGAAFSRDDLLIFTERTVWSLKYTGNDTTPFTLYKIEESRGSAAPFGVITYLNRTTALSPLGFIITDGYRVDRMDDKIPKYSFNEIDPNNFDLCFAGSVDEDRDHYLIHPSTNQAESDRILVTNYEEDNFSIYRIPLSCMGNYIESFDITWDDLLVYDNWDDFATDYASWNAFGYTKGTPISIGGGHHGEIWRLNLDQGEDNPVKVRNITYPDAANDPRIIDVETDFQNYTAGDPSANIPADYIYFENVGGLTDINDKQFPIMEVLVPNRAFRINKNTLSSTAYTSGGDVARVIPFESTTKNFNPFANADKKVRCGWMYFYVSTSETFLKDENGETVPAKITVEVYANDSTMPAQVFDFIVSPYEGNTTNLPTQIGAKKWTKLWINQTARMIQFKVKNTQAGSKIRIHAMMPGFAPVGRLI